MGSKNDSPIWLRDRIPSALRERGIKARVLSLGYNSRVVGSNSVINIEDIAKSLLGRLYDLRDTKKEKATPIIFVAHSLGGLIVKKVGKHPILKA